MMERHINSLHIFMDGSKTTEHISRDVVAFYVENHNCSQAMRPPDDLSIYAAELAAIQMAINWISTSKITEDTTIFSDSLSVIQSIKT